MPRVDIWDVAKAKEAPPIDAGFPRGFEDRFELGKPLGKGGFGTVRLATDRTTGAQFACKTVAKALDLPDLSPARQAAHVANIQREVAVLRKLRGTLNVVALEGAWEDETAIHIVMEYCRGGELLHSIAARPHYSEQTVASIMRAVLRTLAQCHSAGILHRDVKPGNFMFLDDRPDAPIKAIDFGLAVFFDPASLPRTDLGLEGTPWFMAPEVLSSRVGPPADVWAAGVMAYQLLCGRLPFDDRRNPAAPALSVVWKAILSEAPRVEGGAWADVSAPAKAFVAALLAKDPAARPSARAALRHPWLAGDVSDRYKGRPLRATVVQRVQRFAQAPALQRSIFELMAAEVLRLAPGGSGASPGGSGHGVGDDARADGADAPPAGGLAAALADAPPPPPSVAAPPGDGGATATLSRAVSAGNLLRALRAGQPAAAAAAGSPAAGTSASAKWGSATAHAGMEFLRWRAAGGEPGGGSGASAGGGGAAPHSFGDRRRSSVSGDPGRSAHTLHGGADYWRIMRAAAAAAVAARGGPGGSVHGGGGGGGARLGLAAAAAPAASTFGPSQQPEGSTHSGSEYLRTAARTAAERGEQRKAARLMLDTSHHGGADYDRLVRGFAQHAQHAGQRRVSFDLDGRGAPGGEELRHKPAGGSTPQGNQQPSAPTVAALVAAPPGASPPLPGAAADAPAEEERGRRRQGAYAQFLSGGGGGGGMAVDATSPASPPGLPPLAPQPGAIRTPSRVTFAGAAGDMDLDDVGGAGGAGVAVPPCGASPSEPPPVSSPSLSLHPDDSGGGGTPSSTTSAGGGSTVSLSELRDIMRRLNFGPADEAVTAGALADGLGRLGYRVDPAEAVVLADAITGGRRGGGGGGGGQAAGTAATTSSGPPPPPTDLPSPRIPRAAFAASQLDWSTLQTNYRDLWLAAAERVFGELGGDAAAPGSAIAPSALVSALREKLPAAEVDYAVEDALLEAGLADAEALDFEGFLKLLTASGGALGPGPRADPDASVHGLSQFDPRLAASRPSLDGSAHGGRRGSGGVGGGLAPVEEG